MIQSSALIDASDRYTYQIAQPTEKLCHHEREREAFLDVYLTHSTNDVVWQTNNFFLCNFIIYINNLIIIIMEDEADKSMRIIRDVQRYSMSLASVFRTSFR